MTSDDGSPKEPKPPAFANTVLGEPIVLRISSHGSRATLSVDPLPLIRRCRPPNFTRKRSSNWKDDLDDRCGRMNESEGLKCEVRAQPWLRRYRSRVDLDNHWSIYLSGLCLYSYF